MREEKRARGAALCLMASRALSGRSPAHAGASPCTKPRVAVEPTELTQETCQEVLARQWPSRTRGYRLRHMQDTMIGKIMADSQGIAEWKWTCMGPGKLMTDSPGRAVYPL